MNSSRSGRWQVLIALALGVAACSGAPVPETPAADAGGRDVEALDQGSSVKSSASSGT